MHTGVRIKVFSNRQLETGWYDAYMKKFALSICALFALAAPGFAQEGYSPTLPFGTKEYQVNRTPTVSNMPSGYSPYNYNYYYGQYGVYNNNYYYQNPYGQRRNVRNYRYRNPNERPPQVQQRPYDDTLPSYRNSDSGYPSLPGY